MRAFVRIATDELALQGPLSTCLRVVADHLAAPARTTLDRIALIDRDRAPGNHAFDCDEFLQLILSAYALLGDPPAALRKARRVPDGPLPAAERIGVLVSWVRERRAGASSVIYDLWSSTSTYD